MDIINSFEGDNFSERLINAVSDSKKNVSDKVNNNEVSDKAVLMSDSLSVDVKKDIIALKKSLEERPQQHVAFIKFELDQIIKEFNNVIVSDDEYRLINDNNLLKWKLNNNAMLFNKNFSIGELDCILFQSDFLKKYKEVYDSEWKSNEFSKLINRLTDINKKIANDAKTINEDLFYDEVINS